MTTWMDRAACTGHDPEIFFPTSGLREDRRQAIEICSGCPVSSECLQYSIDINATHGIWAGIAIVTNEPQTITKEEETELREGVRVGLQSGWDIKQVAKHLNINYQRALKYKREIEKQQEETATVPSITHQEHKPRSPINLIINMLRNR